MGGEEPHCIAGGFLPLLVVIPSIARDLQWFTIIRKTADSSSLSLLGMTRL